MKNIVNCNNSQLLPYKKKKTWRMIKEYTLVRLGIILPHVNYLSCNIKLIWQVCAYKFTTTWQEESETEGLSSKVNKYIGLQMHSKSYLTLWYMIRTTKTFTHCSRLTKKAANNVLTGISFVRKSKTFKLINHVPKASDLQAFRAFSQHPKWVITLVNP